MSAMQKEKRALQLELQDLNNVQEGECGSDSLCFPHPIPTAATRDHRLFLISSFFKQLLFDGNQKAKERKSSRNVTAAKSAWV